MISIIAQKFLFATWEICSISSESWYPPPSVKFLLPLFYQIGAKHFFWMNNGPWPSLTFRWMGWDVAKHLKLKFSGSYGGTDNVRIKFKFSRSLKFRYSRKSQKRGYGHRVGLSAASLPHLSHGAGTHSSQTILRNLWVMSLNARTHRRYYLLSLKLNFVLLKIVLLEMYEMRGYNYLKKKKKLN